MNLTTFKIEWNNPHPVNLFRLFDETHWLQEQAKKAKIDIQDLYFLSKNLFVHIFPSDADKAAKQYKQMQKYLKLSNDEMKKKFFALHKVVWTAYFQAQDFKAFVKHHNDELKHFCPNPTPDMFDNYVKTQYDQKNDLFVSHFEIIPGENTLKQVNNILTTFASLAANPQEAVAQATQELQRQNISDMTGARIKVSPNTFEIVPFGHEFKNPQKAKVK